MLQAFLTTVILDRTYLCSGRLDAEKWTIFSKEWKSILEMRPRVDYFKFSEAMPAFVAGIHVLLNARLQRRGWPE